MVFEGCGAEQQGGGGEAPVGSHPLGTSVVGDRSDQGSGQVADTGAAGNGLGEVGGNSQTPVGGSNSQGTDLPGPLRILEQEGVVADDLAGGAATGTGVLSFEHSNDGE